MRGEEKGGVGKGGEGRGREEIKGGEEVRRYMRRAKKGRE